MFETNDPRKHFLHIATESKRNITNHVIDLTCLEEALSKVIEFPDGELHHICNIEDILVLMCNIPVVQVFHNDTSVL